MSDHPRRVLVVLMGSLGDVVRGMYIVDALKNADSTIHITWLVEPACAGIVKLHPRIDRVIVFDRSRGARGVLALRRELARQPFDITLDMQRHLKSGFFSLLSRAPRRIGFHRKDSKEFNWLFNTEQIPPRGESIPKVQHYLLFVAQLGIPLPEALSSGLEQLSLDSISAPWREELPKDYIALILGSSWDSKDWPEEGYRELIERLGGRNVVLVSDKTKVELASRLESINGGARVINLAGKTTLRELVAIIHGAVSCVGPDSGPAHIAGAVGTRHVTLFGPTPSVRNSPRGSEDLSISMDVGCAPCKRRKCPGLGKVCMKLVHPSAVLERIQRPL